MSEQVIPRAAGGQSGQAVLRKTDDEAAHSDLRAHIEELRKHALYEMPLL